MLRFNKIMKSFKKAQTKLDALVVSCSGKSTAINEEIDSLKTTQKSVIAEGTVAENASRAIGKILGD